MARWSSWLRCLMAGACWLAAASSPPDAFAQDAPTAGSDPSAPANWALTMFDVPAEVVLDESLRREIESLRQEQIRRLHEQWPRWLEAEVKATGLPASDLEVGLRMMARFANELALWRVDRVDESHDRVWLAALERTTLCRHLVELRPLASLAAMLQQLPPDERPAALVAERELLGRWGSTPRSIPARPVPSLDDGLEADLPAWREGRRRPAMPMWPMVAWWLQAEDANEYRRAGVAADCAIHQWSALEGIRSGRLTPPQALRAWRYAMVLRLRDLLPQYAPDPKAAPGDYPLLARRFGIEGGVTVEVERDAGGRVQAARVVGRDIRVPGVLGVPAVAFEAALDEASLARARAMAPPAASSASPAARSPVRTTFQWALR